VPRNKVIENDKPFGKLSLKMTKRQRAFILEAALRQGKYLWAWAGAVLLAKAEQDLGRPAPQKDEDDDE
jgi:hypothetical protein